MKQSIAVVSENCERINKLHINYWAVSGIGKTRICKKQDAIDFGVDIPPGSAIKISVVMPSDLIVGKPLCLAEKTVKDEGLLNALFNETCSKVSNSDLHKVIVKVGNVDKDFIIFGDLRADKFKNYDGCSSIDIDIPASDNDRYVRFRVFVNPINSFSKIKSHYTSVLESILMKRRLIDFRVNSYRQFLPEFLRNEKFLKIDAVHFFFLHHSDEFVERCSDNLHKERFLETSVWNDYAPGNISSDKESVWEALHSKKDMGGEGETFNVYVASKFRKMNWKNFFYTISITFILGIVVNLSSNYFGSIIFDEESETVATTNGSSGIDNDGDEAASSLVQQITAGSGG